MDGKHKAVFCGKLSRKAGKQLSGAERAFFCAAMVVVIFGCVVTLTPFIWMISTSVKTAGEAFSMPPSLFPNRVMWENYSEVARRIPMARYFFNSVAVTVLITSGTLITTILAAFAFSRLKFPGRDAIFAFFVALMIIPDQATLIPNYITLSNLGWLNTFKGLTVPWTVSVFSIFMLRQFFLSIPESLYRAAKADGCSDIRFIIEIMLPVSRPAIITVALLRVINSWNEFIWPLVVTNRPDMRTLPVAMTTFTSEAGNHYHLMMAAATMVIIPIILIYLFMQKYIISGITKSGIKG